MTPKEMLIFHFGCYFGQQKTIEESTTRLLMLSKALKVSIDDLDKTLQDIIKSMEGMKILSKVTGINY